MLALSMLVIPMAVMFNLCRTPGAERPFLYGSKGLGDGQTALLLMFICSHTCRVRMHATECASREMWMPRIVQAASIPVSCHRAYP